MWFFNWRETELQILRNNAEIDLAENAFEGQTEEALR